MPPLPLLPVSMIVVCSTGRSSLSIGRLPVEAY
jgi:hypothetical protein